MTYLQLVNQVLKRLREAQVGNVSANSYSSLIGEFVNDAKQEVENVWNWGSLLTSYTVTGTGVASQFTISGLTHENSRLAYDENDRPLVFDTTSSDEFQLNEYPFEAYTRRFKTDPDSFATNDKPYWFAINFVGGAWKISFDGNPANGRTYNTYFYVPQADLSDNSDNMTVPWRPVVHLALLYALDERGEEIGEPGSKAWRRYDDSLASAISMDAIGDSHKITFKAD